MLTGANRLKPSRLQIGAGKGMGFSPLELAAAYIVFPNNGLKVMCRSISASFDYSKGYDENKATRIAIAKAKEWGRRGKPEYWR